MSLYSRRSRKRRCNLLDHALAYHDRGWSIIPTTVSRAGTCKPIIRWTPCQTEPASEDHLRDWFGRRNPTGIAVILGSASGNLAARDFDTESGYQHWRELQPDLARTLPTSQTSRGKHVYFRVPDDALGFVDYGDGEYRADSRHYCILPPSRHKNGRTIYRWLISLPDGELPLVDPVSTGLTVAVSASSTGIAEEHKQHTALHACMARTVEEAVLLTLPSGPGQRNRCIFELARQLKAIPGLDASPGKLRGVFQEWHARALPVITTKNFTESWQDFQVAWSRVQHPAGASLTRAFAVASADPLPSIDGVPELGILAAACRELAQSDGSFFLSSYAAAKHLGGVDPKTAWRWLLSLEFHGLIECVRRGDRGTSPGTKASEWRFIGAE